MSDSYINEMREKYKADRFAIEAAGAQIDSCEEGRAVCSLEIGPLHVNGHGMVMGGVSFTLADFAFAVACDAMRTKTVTLSSSVQFLSAPKGKRLVAEARCVREGRSACFYSVSVRDDLGRHVAEVSITGHRVGG
ncbi:MAG: PaaI family thioesterase [Eubacteriales bacterium]|nr:PaaI family thioesterase [Eubacteriales bacterium]